MSQEEKIAEMNLFLEENAFKPMLKIARDENNEYIEKVIKKTMNNFKTKKNVKEFYNYFINVTQHKSSSAENFYNLLNRKGIDCKLEDVQKEFFNKFNQEWLDSEV